METVSTTTCITASSSVCMESVTVSGRHGPLEVSIPTLHAMGLTILWIVIVGSVAYVLQKFS